MGHLHGKVLEELHACSSWLPSGTFVFNTFHSSLSPSKKNKTKTKQNKNNNNMHSHTAVPMGVDTTTIPML